MNLKEKFKTSVHKHVDRFYPINQNLVCQTIICQIPVEENISLEKGDLKQCARTQIVEPFPQGWVWPLSLQIVGTQSPYFHHLLSRGSYLCLLRALWTSRLLPINAQDLWPQNHQSTCQNYNPSCKGCVTCHIVSLQCDPLQALWRSLWFIIYVGTHSFNVCSPPISFFLTSESRYDKMPHILFLITIVYTKW